MLILGLETSCDETGVALYDTGRGLLAHALFSQENENMTIRSMWRKNVVTIKKQDEEEEEWEEEEEEGRAYEDLKFST